MAGDGANAETVNVTPGDVPPPGVGVYTVTVALSAEAMSAAVMEASKPTTSVPPDDMTGVVVREDPVHLTVEFPAKVSPFTRNVKALPPAVALVGLREVITGAGALTLKFA